MPVLRSGRFSIVPPDPAGTIESLSALGYSLEAAVADIVDNSIDAKASKVDIHFHWDGSNSHVAVVDNGLGMAEDGLVEAMALAKRGPGTRREDRELGRFGMGMKTASFSQSTHLSVWSMTSESPGAFRAWDLDEVIGTGEWRLMETVDPSTESRLNRYIPKVTAWGSGTVVVWSGLRRLVGAETQAEDEDALAHFHDAIARVEWHLGMTFARFMRARPRKPPVGVRINGRTIEPWDPFMAKHSQTLAQPTEKLLLEGAEVVVSPFVLPPRRSLSDDDFERGGGPRGWLEQQGFYLYRNDRLIVAGDWLGLPRCRKDEKHILARIAVDVPASLDRQWSIDVKKASAEPPLQLRGSLRRTARATREQARRVLSTGVRVTARQHADELSYVWKPESKGGELRLRLNWQHPMVQDALDVAADDRGKLKSLLRFMEETAPIGALRVMFDPETVVEHAPFSDAPEEVVEIARRMYESFISRGLTPHQAKQRLTHTSPFDEFPELVEQLNI